MSISVSTARTNIYNRLAAAPTFKPASANMFMDWTHEPGDVISVSSGDVSANVPIYSMGIRWNGATTVQVVSSGDEERPSLTKMAQQQVGSSYGASYRAYRGGFRMSQDIYHAIYDPTTGLSTQIQATAGKVSVVVDGNGNIKPASIVAAINEQTGLSQVKLDADQIDIDGIVTALNAYDISVATLDVEGQAEFHEGVYIDDQDAFLQVSTLHVTDSIDVDGNTLNVADVQPNGNTLTITYVDGTTTTFSKAITLTRALGDGKVTINANTNVASYDVVFGGSYASTRTNLEVSLNGTVTAGSAANTIDIPIAVSALTGAQTQPQSIYTKTITAAYSGGSGNANIVKGSWDNGNITFTKSTSSGASTQSVSLDAADPVWASDYKSVSLEIYDGDPGGSGVSTGKTFSISTTAITVTSVNLRHDLSPLTSSQTRSQPIIEAIASNGNYKTQRLVLQTGTYDGGDCVNLKIGSDIIGRIHVNLADAPTVAFNSIASNVTGGITGSASCGTLSTSISMQWAISSYDYSTSTEHLCATVTYGNHIVGRLDINPAVVWSGSSSSSSRSVNIRAGGVTGNTITASLSQTGSNAYLNWNGTKLTLALENVHSSRYALYGLIDDNIDGQGGTDMYYGYLYTKNSSTSIFNDKRFWYTSTIAVGSGENTYVWR